MWLGEWCGHAVMWLWKANSHMDSEAVTISIHPITILIYQNIVIYVNSLSCSIPTWYQKSTLVSLVGSQMHISEGKFSAQSQLWCFTKCIPPHFFHLYSPNSSSSFPPSLSSSSSSLPPSLPSFLPSSFPLSSLPTQPLVTSFSVVMHSCIPYITHNDRLSQATNTKH